MGQQINLRRMVLVVIIVGMGLLLGIFTTSEYVLERGIDYISQGGEQLARHQAVLEGRAGSPWQYRVLAPYLLEGVLTLFEHLHVPNHVAAAFTSLRVIQDTLILLLAYVYYRKLRLSLPHALVGMALLAWSMSYSHHNSDLQFSTFFDVIFYLAAGLCLLYARAVWLPFITLLAAMNRETSAVIPFLLLATFVFVLPRAPLRKMAPVFLASLGIFIVIFFGLRLLYEPQKAIFPAGHHPGLDLLQYNLFRAVTWRQLLATLSIVPIVAVIGYRTWPVQLQAFFWVIVPVWFVVHALGAVMAETRLLLVPQAMVFIPGALLTLGSPSLRSE